MSFPASKMANQFIADVHLGKLAKWLRLLGFDVVYNNGYSNDRLLQLAEEGQRILLSRNPAFQKVPGITALLIESEDPFIQLGQVMRIFHLEKDIRPFTRCLLCNGCLERVEKEAIVQQLEENTGRYYNEFWQCNACRKLYWKGSHYNRMMQFIEQLADLS